MKYVVLILIGAVFALMMTSILQLGELADLRDSFIQCQHERANCRKACRGRRSAQSVMFKKDIDDGSFAAE